MYKMLYILIFSTLLFSCSDSENLDSAISEKQDPKAKDSENSDSTNLRKQDPIRLAVVRIGDKWGYINQKGEIVTKLQFDGADSFSEELAVSRVQIGRKWGYINREGKTNA